MREWLRGGAPPCQGGGRGSESRFPLIGQEDREIDPLFLFSGEERPCYFASGVRCVGRFYLRAPMGKHAPDRQVALVAPLFGMNRPGVVEVFPVSHRRWESAEREFRFPPSIPGI